MGYITAEYYAAAYGNETVDDITLLIERASDIIDSMVIYPIDVKTLPPYALECLKKAAAAEVAYIDENGGIAALNTSALSQATLGKFSYSRSSNGGSSKLPVSPLASAFLEQGGFLRRGLAP